MTIGTRTVPLAGAGAAAGPDSAGEAVRRALRALEPAPPVAVIAFPAPDLGPAGPPRRRSSPQATSRWPA